ncbi:hypothetical protein ACIBK8_17515 [Streptomyces sp. NPDC050161]|uniref:hypothetical protein n=1 Tax=Streptomyces sp. NPDC050161 TaxID=3365604 RepID=UPI0037ADCD2C
MPELPDYFDRLLARHAAAPAAGPPGLPADAPGRPARVRPRLPGPFERIESLGGGRADEGPAPGLLAPPAAAPRPPGRAFTRVEREVRTTERETVVRPGPVPQDVPDDGGERVRPSAAPLLRPAAPVTGRARQDTAEPVRQVRTVGATRDDDTAAGRASVRPAASAPAATAPVPAGVARPRGDLAAAVRGAAARQGAGRRGGRPAERVVHVQIGRLEVTAAGGQARGEAAAPARTARRGPALSLTDYLSRDEKRN